MIQSEKHEFKLVLREYQDHLKRLAVLKDTDDSVDDFSLVLQKWLKNYDIKSLDYVN